MYKEFIIIFTIIAIIIGLDILCNNYIEKTVNNISEDLNILKRDIEEKNQIQSQEKMQEIKEKWRKKYNVLAYYIEHDELEKVETKLTELSADIDTKEYEHCINDIQVTMFILEHMI